MLSGKYHTCRYNPYLQIYPLFADISVEISDIVIPDAAYDKNILRLRFSCRTFFKKMKMLEKNLPKQKIFTKYSLQNCNIRILIFDW